MEIKVDDIKRTSAVQGVPQKAADEAFCTSCGKIIKQAALFCVNCGVSNASAPAQPPVAASGNTVPKQKSSAILLAVFLGLWAWLYTYRKDAWKFWVNLALCVLSLGMWTIIAWIWAIIDVCIKPEEYYTNFSAV